MTPDRLRDCLDVLHWHDRDLADALQVSVRVCQRWVSGRREIPPAIAAWLDKLTHAILATLAAHPPPMLESKDKPPS
jgi:hypothetical protein